MIYSKTYNATLPFNYAAFPKKLNLGCGFDHLKGFLNVDINDFHQPDLVADITDLKILPSAYYDEILAQDVLEHLPRIKTKSALIEWNRLLKIGGLLNLRVPNVLGIANLLTKEQNATIEMQESLIQCLFGTQAYNGDYHFTSFSDIILRAYLEQAGFDVISLVSKDEWLFDCSAKKIKDVSLNTQIQLLKITDLDELVRAAYIELLGREVDTNGYAYYIEALKSDALSREQFLEAIYASKEFQNKSEEKLLANQSDQIRTNDYDYQPAQKIEYEKAVKMLEEKGGHRIVKGAIDNISLNVVEEILEQANSLGIEIKNYIIDISQYEGYFEQAEYKIRYPNYYMGNIKEKSLEHYIALQLLDVNEHDVFIDLASEHSPVPEIYARLKGSRTYSQDIMYPEGIHDNKIGGDACAMPLPDGFASKATLTCSIEHFEGDADTRLFRELSRVLKVGGKVVVVPFYLFTDNATQTDPTISVPAQVMFDENCTIFCAEGWGNRHGRFYSPATFMQRIAHPMHGKFYFDYYYLKNAAEVDFSIYARFVFVGTKL